MTSSAGTAAPAAAPAASPAAVADALLARLVADHGASGGALVLMHPQTGLFWTGAVNGLPAPSCHPFFAIELGSSSARTFRRLAADGRGATALSREGDGDPFRIDVLEPFGYSDELRVACVDGGTAWAGVSLWRRTGTFRVDDERRLTDTARDVARAVRAAVMVALDGSAADGERGLLLVQDGEVVESSRTGTRFLRELRQPQLEEYRHLDHLLALASTQPDFSTVLSTPDGGWVTAHGTDLGGGRVAITLGRATPTELLGPRVAGAGLTPREVEVTRLLCRGFSDREIARELAVSAHTVHDHVRSVRSKLGVRSRSEVVAQVFDEHYFAGFLQTAAVSHAPGG
ncbi:MAG: response regulator transcription factor [Angustibacter sp.]